MKYAISGEHLKFFRTHHYVQFEQVLSEVQLKEIKDSCIQALSSRLQIPETKIPFCSFEKLQSAGHDLFRISPTIHRLVTKKNFAEIAFELCNEKPLRIAYDQLFYLEKDKPSLSHNNHLNLKMISGLQGFVIGLLLCIEPGENPSTLPPFLDQKGSGLFFSEELSFSFDSFLSNPGACYLLIVFTGSKSIVLQEQFFSPSYKHVGYQPGDLLKDDLNSIVWV